MGRVAPAQVDWWKRTKEGIEIEPPFPGPEQARVIDHWLIISALISLLIVWPWAPTLLTRALYFHGRCVAS